ncbi:hypothetical protein [Methylomonas fluvii]|uniref:Apea-like HEPN domain-containing protein n=1 Tax=Methylomonas fluvii TaxID=1854564 RepID=A0ABR9DEN2_9GAMM|nr:hypothetical protein [Methylomonas fluvii]MBD9360773.1 hypothetical protein [Methylomonas fluvii]CAD6873630.1 hypothetical protein [Methylomonas fluvii]
MPEVIYNLFVYTDGKIVTDLGFVQYNIVEDGSDEKKIEFLRARALLDHGGAYKAKVVSPEINLESYYSKHRLGTALAMFEEFFQLVNAPPDPLFAMTVVENGEVKISYSYTGSTLDLSDKTAGFVDYLVHYTSENRIDFGQMFEDDYFKAIKLLFNNGFLVSSAKLLMVFVDTVAFVEFGDEQGSFVKWLDAYTSLSSIDLEASELWEFRNGVLHMSNLHSRRVLSGKVQRLVPCVNLGATLFDKVRNEKQFDLLSLIEIIVTGVGKWVETYNVDSLKLEKFVERYDTVISDARKAYRPVAI